MGIDKKIPPRTIERLSKYRRLLTKYNPQDNFIFSHDLARLLNLTPVQVRRDLMLIGVTGNHRKGYNITELIDLISVTIDAEKVQHIAIVGIGNLGRAVTTFIRKSSTKMNIVAAFDNDQDKVGKEIAGVSCFHSQDISSKIKELNIDIAILTVPPDFAVEISEILVGSGIKGILNFTSIHLDVPKTIYLKNYDIITSLEEIGFFIKD